MANEDVYEIPIAWRDDKRIFDYVLYYDKFSNLVFSDNYHCPPHRCPKYDLARLLIEPLVGDEDKEQLIESLIKSLKQHGVEIVDHRIVFWCYTGDKKCEENSWLSWRHALKSLYTYLNEGYEIIELVEKDEGDSILLVVRPDDISKIKKLLDAEWLF